MKSKSEKLDFRRSLMAVLEKQTKQLQALSRKLDRLTPEDDEDAEDQDTKEKVRTKDEPKAKKRSDGDEEEKDDSSSEDNGEDDDEDDDWI